MRLNLSALILRRRESGEESADPATGRYPRTCLLCGRQLWFQDLEEWEAFPGACSVCRDRTTGALG